MKDLLGADSIDGLLDTKIKHLTTSEEGEQGLESKHFTFKGMVDRLNDQITQIDAQSKQMDKDAQELE